MKPENAPMPPSMGTPCVVCGALIPKSRSRGQPRKVCEACSPKGTKNRGDPVRKLRFDRRRGRDAPTSDLGVRRGEAPMPEPTEGSVEAWEQLAAETYEPAYLLSNAEEPPKKSRTSRIIKGVTASEKKLLRLLHRDAGGA